MEVVILISSDVCFIYLKILKWNKSLASVNWIFPGFSETIMRLMILEFRLTGLNQPVMLDCGFQWWSQKSASSADPGLFGMWFHTIEKSVWSQAVLRWASVYLGCRVVPFGPVSYCRGSWSSSKNLSFTYILLLLLAVGYWHVPWTSTALWGQLVQRGLWSDLDWSDIKPETLQTTPEPGQSQVLELFCM